jgi:multiple sugar transport system substrate-binding protein
LIDNKIIDSSAKNWGWEETDENFATGITSTYVTGNWLAERESSNPDTMGDVSDSIPS